MRCSKNKRDENKRKIRGTSYIPPVKRENEKISSFGVDMGDVHKIINSSIQASLFC
jgi:hypothetical protein